jgi:hypothetical protein
MAAGEERATALMHGAKDERVNAQRSAEGLQSQGHKRLFWPSRGTTTSIFQHRRSRRTTSKTYTEGVLLQ